ncbi:NUDIX domain-containing protein [Streptomyces europaeiscabiei]|uniref:NUDIX domain-containing protein n=1 Tax=Streptomyces europaeiscabiei TaxID=146819 RepID=UPI002E150246
MLSPPDARRALSALRARINAAGTVLLENGLPLALTVLDRLGVLQTARPTYRYPWQHGPAPHDLTVTQVWAWLFASDGRLLVPLEPHTGAAILPGGTPEKQDQGDPVATLRREAEEEAAARFGSPQLLGHVTDPAVQRGYLRYAAALTDVGPIRPYPATGHTYTRILATPEQATDLFDWSPAAVDQLAAVHKARRQLGLPRAARQPVTQLTGPTAW